MKHILTLLALMLFFMDSKGQKIFSVQYEHQADVKVFVVQYEHQADLKVFKVEYEHQAKENNGLWYFVQYEHQAQKKIFFCAIRASGEP